MCCWVSWISNIFNNSTSFSVRSGLHTNTDNQVLKLSKKHTLKVHIIVTFNYCIRFILLTFFFIFFLLWGGGVPKNEKREIRKNELSLRFLDFQLIFCSNYCYDLYTLNMSRGR